MHSALKKPANFICTCYMCVYLYMYVCMCMNALASTHNMMESNTTQQNSKGPSNEFHKTKYSQKCGPDVSILAGPLSKALIKVLLGSKRQARIFWDIYILVILVSKQFATFLHISTD